MQVGGYGVEFAGEVAAGFDDPGAGAVEAVVVSRSEVDDCVVEGCLAGRCRCGTPPAAVVGSGGTAQGEVGPDLGFGAGVGVVPPLVLPIGARLGKFGTGPVADPEFVLQLGVAAGVSGFLMAWRG